MEKERAFPEMGDLSVPRKQSATFAKKQLQPKQTESTIDTRESNKAPSRISTPLAGPIKGTVFLGPFRHSWSVARYPDVTPIRLNKRTGSAKRHPLIKKSRTSASPSPIRRDQKEQERRAVQRVTRFATFAPITTLQSVR